MKSNAIIRIAVPRSSKDVHFSFKLRESKPEPFRFHSKRIICVVSDFKGDFSLLTKTLVRNGVINRKFEWSLGSGDLVILGNCIDSLADLQCLWFIYALEEKAKRDGGYVHFLLGLSELRCLSLHWPISHPYYAINTSLGTNVNAIYRGNLELRDWMNTKNTAEQIGNILFFTNAESRSSYIEDKSVNRGKMHGLNWDALHEQEEGVSYSLLYSLNANIAVTMGSDSEFWIRKMNYEIKMPKSEGEFPFTVLWFIDHQLILATRKGDRCPLL